MVLTLLSLYKRQLYSLLRYVGELIAAEVGSIVKPLNNLQDMLLNVIELCNFLSNEIVSMVLSLIV